MTTLKSSLVQVLPGAVLLANDTGGAINGYRIDLFNGAGYAACASFQNIITIGACNPGNPRCPTSAVQ